MSRTLVNFWLDFSLLLSFLSLVWISFVLRFVFPPATTADGWRLWGWTYDQWLDLHFGCLCLLALGVLIHVMLHWSWVCGVLTTRLLPAKGKRRPWDDGERTLVGVGLMVVLLNLLGIAMAAAMFTVQHPT